MSYGRGHKLTIEECQNKVSRVSPNIEVIEYISAIVPVACKCKLCGNIWREPAKNLYRGSNCPICFKRKNNKWDTVSLIAAIDATQPNIQILGEYHNMHTKVACRCNSCGNRWSVKPDSLLHGRGCPVCAQKNSTSHATKTHSFFIEEMTAKHPLITVLGEYQRAKMPVACKCNMCGREWAPAPSNLLNGQGCPDCGRARIRTSQLKSHQTFKDELSVINPGIAAVSQYTGAHDHITLECKVCHTQWKCIASNAISHVVGCPTCSASHGEKAIAAHLKEMNITFIPQYRFKGLVGVGGALLSYDFYLPDLGILIEYQGEYHDGSVAWQTDEQLSRQREHDNRKRKFAHDNGYQFLEIWYWEYLNIQQILQEKIQSIDAA